jgi:hypothetical protein
MKAKEKAQSLINKFNIFVLDTALGGSNARVKQCALIAVDEVLNAINVNTGNAAQGRLIQSLNNYWEQVKKEIEKL